MVILKVRNASGTFVDIPAIVGPKGDTGISISTITKTATSGLTDTYTITFSDGHTSCLRNETPVRQSADQSPHASDSASY